MTTVVVTGAGGYLGGRLVAKLQSVPGVVAIPLVRKRRSWLGDDQREVDLIASPLATVIDALGRADAIVHLAGASEVEAAAQPEEAHTSTVSASRHIGEAAAAAGIRRVVYVSTVHVYGRALAPGARIIESTTPAPTAAYAEARLVSERLLQQRGDLDLVVLRLTNAVGAPPDPAVDRWTLVGNDLCRQAVVERRIVLRTSGTQHRDFVDIGDACHAISAAVDPTLVPAGTVNLGSGVPRTVRWLAERVQHEIELITGERPPIEAPPPEADAPAPPMIDIGRLRQLELAPTTPIEQSVRDTIAFCRTHRRVLATRST
ncbi:MAG: UDP-glucose 4-epimerase [Acidimicrobiaceae bacterium]|jgi:UDP-glucose 4-epimerase